MPLSAIFNRALADGHVPALPPVTATLLAIASRGAAGAADIVALIEKDPTLATRLLRYASLAPPGGVARRAGSLQQAVSFVGLRGIGAMAATTHLAARPQAEIAPALAEGFDYPRFWNHAVTAAVSARLLARAATKVPPEDALAAGFFARIGALTFAAAEPARYAQVLRDWRSSTRELVEVELDHFGGTHLDLGARVVRHYGLPETVAHAILSLGAAPQDDATPLMHAVRVADFVGRLVSDPVEQTTPRIERLLQLAQTGLSLDTRTVHQHLDELAKGRKDMLALIATSPSESKVLATLSVAAQDQLPELAAATEPEASGLRERERVELQRAFIDKVAGCANRTAFDQRLGLELYRAERTREPLAVLLIELESLGVIADKESTSVANQLLRGVTDVLTRILRRIDFVARYGTNELVIIAARCDRAGARILGDRIRAVIPTVIADWRGRTFSLKASVGAAVTQWPSNPATHEGLIAAADDALYAARRQGGNTVCVR